MTGFELADGERGVFAAATERGAAVVFHGERTLAASPSDGGLRLPEDVAEDSEATLALALDGASLEAGLSPLGVAAALEGDLIGRRRLAVCRALGTVHGDGGETPIACLAVTRDTDAPPAVAGLRRSVAILFGDGGLFALAAARPEGRQHADEEIASVLVEADGRETRFPRALLSTEYDAEGRHRRATLELERDEGAPEPPTRGAGTVICEAAVDLGDALVRTAFFRWALDGRPGLGSYEIVTPR